MIRHLVFSIDKEIKPDKWSKQSVYTPSLIVVYIKVLLLVYRKKLTTSAHGNNSISCLPETQNEDDIWNI